MGGMLLACGTKGKARGAAEHVRDVTPPRGRGARTSVRHQQRRPGVVEDPV
jgi:hypothetical protein